MGGTGQEMCKFVLNGNVCKDGNIGTQQEELFGAIAARYRRKPHPMPTYSIY